MRNPKNKRVGKGRTLTPEEVEKMWAGAMKLEDFEIGEPFMMSGNEYVCVDIGTWCVVAVRLGPREMTQAHYDENGKRIEKPVVHNLTIDQVRGPPYSTWGPQVIIPEEFPACNPVEGEDDVSDHT